MAVSSALTLLLFCLVLCTQALEHQSAFGRRSKRDTLAASTSSNFSNVERRLAALEASWNNSIDKRLTQLEVKLEKEMQEKLQAMQGGMQRLESMMSIITEKMAEMVEAKANATEESAALLEATKTEPQSSSATCQYQYQYQFERESSHSSGEQQRMAKLESELTRLQEKMSALDKNLQENDLNVRSLQNASVQAMEDVVHSMTELVAASEQSLKSTMENATKLCHKSPASMINATFFASMMSDLEARLLASVENNTATLTKELTTRVSAVEDKLDNATSLHAEEIGKIRTRCEDIQKQIADLKNHTTEVRGPLRYIRTCQTYYEEGQRTSGVYRLQLQDGQGPVEVFCDMSKGAGWVVFQRRHDGSVDFYRNWTSYEEGFGDLFREFWLGNRNIHRLTGAGLTQLRVDLQAWNGSTAFASYSHFSVGNASSSYTLSVSGYSGTAGDSLELNNGRKFSTHDQDHDDINGNCALMWKGAWWYRSCTASNLNGEYGTRGSFGNQYVVWYHWLDWQSLQRTELKLK